MGRTGNESSRRLPRHLRYEDIPTHTFTPRTYQVELLEAAVQQNTLVCLGATSSRMFLGVMLLKELGHQVQRPLDQGGKRSVFLVSSASDIPLYAQVIEHHTDFTVGQYFEVSQCHDDDWWTQEIQKSQTLVMLPSIFQYILDKRLLHLSLVNVLIFDHCQHVLEADHPYAHIASKLKSQSEEGHCPRILGLTSCFTSSHCQDPIELVTTIKQLEEKLSASAETSTLVYSERYGMRPKEFVFECDSYEDQTGMVEELGNILESTLNFLQECNVKLEDKNAGDPIETPKTVICECLNILYRLGPWCAASLAQMFVTQLEKIDKHETVDIKKKFLKLAATQLRLLITYFDNNFTPDYDVEELLLYTTPKVKKLIDHLRRFKPECDFKIISTEDVDGVMGDDAYMSDDSLNLTDISDDEDNDKSQGSKVIHVAVKKDVPEEKSGVQFFSGTDDKYLCGIVFVDHRYVAYALNKFIEEVCAWDDQLCFIKSHHITGHGTRGSKKGGGKGNKKQEEILRKFRLQELNLLLATDVLEDGVDIPKCNLIVKFDTPKDYRSYSQSKGRARARESEYVILADKASMKSFKSELSTYKEIEGVLKGRWKASDSDDDLSSMNDNINDLYHDILPPYKPSKEEGSVQVTLTTAIGLVNRYCAKLPSDAFTHLTPKCTIHHTQKGDQTVYSALLRLPINSPMKETIEGITMATKMLAKQAVALKACEILHKSGEIDDQLLPIGKELFMKDEEESVVWDAEDLTGEARPGTTKRKQYYFKRLASSLVQGHPKTVDNFLYLIHLKLTQPISDDQNTRGRRVYTPEETMRGFGLLSAKHIPKIPTFPLYTRSGEVTASLDLLQSSSCFTDEELVRLKDFHRFVFTEVLRLEKDPMEFQPDQADLGYCIIPLNRKTEHSDYSVDWNFIEEVENSKHTVKRNIYDSKRDKFEFKKHGYEDAVVMPSYRNIDQPQHFYVAEIRCDLNPSSSFPSPELYKTFSEYYTTKYGLTVTNQEQPLLDVDHTSARLNLLTPRYMNQKGVALPTSSAETKKARRENLQQKQILVPELCEVHVFPSSLWRKAVCLPTILYRINYLLVAEEIRIRIATGACIGQVDLPEDFEFPALDFGFSAQDEKEENPKETDQTGTVETITDGENTQCEKNEACGNSSHIRCENIEKEGNPGKIICTERDTKHDKLNKKEINPTAGSELLSQTSQVKICTSEQNYPHQTDDCKIQKADIDQLSGITSNKDIKTESEGYADFDEPCKINQVYANCDKKSCPQNSTSNDNAQNIMNHTHNIQVSGVTTNDLIKDFDKLTTDYIEQTKSSDNDICQTSSCYTVRGSRCDQAKGCDQTQTVDCDNTVINTGNSIGWDNLCDKSKDSAQTHVDALGEDKVDKCQSGDTFEEKLEGGCNKQSKNVDVFASVGHFGESEKSEVKKPVVVDLSKIPFPEPLLSLDEDIDLSKYIGPSPCTILQALTMSNANDFFSLERLETIGDSFLKYAITVYLYCTYPGIHEGKLSYLRSKQVSNCNLYRLGKRKGLAECMISTKFEPYENWLPPGYIINETKRKGPIPNIALSKSNELAKVAAERMTDKSSNRQSPDTTKTWTEDEIDQQILDIEQWQEVEEQNMEVSDMKGVDLYSYSLQTLHSIPDKSIADCVESLIGCYLTSCGKKAALRFMYWLGLKVLPPQVVETISKEKQDVTDPSPNNQDSRLVSGCGYQCPPSPLLSDKDSATDLMEHLLIGYTSFEDKIGYHFKDRSYLLQAFTHASYHYNTITDCYQRLEFLGDAILDYVITRHLYEDSCKYSPGVLTDLRSALVNNNIFAALAVKWDFHKYFKAISPPLFQVIEKFVARQKEREDEIDLEDEDENEDASAEYVELEVPKALGDIFESLAGAIYLDSGLSLDVVWRVYYRMMKPQIDKYLKSIPKSPVRELLEMEPETAKFEKPERTLEGKIRVTVNVVSKGVFVGIGRNYRIAKSAAAKKALRCIKAMQSQGLI